MKLAQFWVPGIGRRIGLVEGGLVSDITSPEQGLETLLGVLAAAASERVEVETVAERAARAAMPSQYRFAELNVPPSSEKPHLLIPFEPPEVWACGVTYVKSAEFRDEEVSTAKGLDAKGMYDHVYTALRPEVFFKATASRCSGPNATVGIRSDSTFTAPEPELGLVLGLEGRILGYTLANDVSAWDIERENPLYLPQSKVYERCCSLGPVFVTARDLPNATSLRMDCRIMRRGKTVFEGATSLSQMRRSFEELVHWATLHNPLPAGTALLTGTGIIVPSEVPLEDGDIIEISAEGIGVLANTAAVLKP